MSAIRSVAIAGVGAKGSGIAEVVARAGIPTLLFDVNRGISERAISAILGRVARDVTAEAQPRQALANAQAALSIATAASDLARVDLVVEALPESLDLKRKVLRALEQAIDPTTLIATNTGWLQVGAIARGLEHPIRFAGLHFLRPATTPVVELIRGPFAGEPMMDRLADFARAIGHAPVLVADRPGFLVAHLGNAAMMEAARIWEAEVADPASIDSILSAIPDFGFAPFATIERVGVAAVTRMARHLREAWAGEPRAREVPALAAWAATGIPGPIGGCVDGANKRPETEAWPGPIHVAGRRADLVERVRSWLPGARLVPRPSSDALSIVVPLGDDTLGEVAALGLDPTQSIGVDAMFETRVVTVAVPPVARSAVRRAAAGLFVPGGRRAVLVRDRPGFVAQATVALFAANAYALLDLGVSSAPDIDLAATRAFGLPMGPLALSRRIGARRLVELLTRLADIEGDGRFRVPVNLRHAAIVSPEPAT